MFKVKLKNLKYSYSIMIKSLFLISLLINLFLLFSKFRKEIKIFLSKSNVIKKDVTELHKMFKLKKISNKSVFGRYGQKNFQSCIK